MKKVKFQDKSEKELHKLLDEKRDALAKFNFGLSGSRASNVKEGRNLRKDIARLLTVLNKQTVKV